GNCGTKLRPWTARRATSNKNSFARRIRRRPPLRRRMIRRRQARVFVRRANGLGRTFHRTSGPRRLRLTRMPAREAMPETPAARYHDFGLLVTLAGPMAEQCLWDGSNLMERAAIHEAGHCVMAWRIGHGIADVCIRADGTGLATTAPM